MQKKLYRSRDNRVLAGIAGGLGEYFDVDPVLVRIIFIVLSMMGGPGLLLYVILWFVIPEEPTLTEKVKNDVYEA